MSTGTSCNFGHLWQVSKKISCKSDFIRLFFMILYMYIAPGQGQTAPRGQSFHVNRNVLSLHSFVASFKKCLWSLFLYNFFHALINVHSPGAGGIQPPGDKVLMSTETSCHFGHLLLVSNHRRQFLKYPFVYLFPIQKLKGPHLILQ